MDRREALLLRMMEYEKGDAGKIQHFLKVHAFSRLIGLGEKLDAKTQEILETAAIVHDIGIRPSMEKYGSGIGRYQELEGPPVARDMLNEMGYPEDLIQRVCWLVGHHHSYLDIRGIDYQILIEADFLVNMHEGSSTPEAIQSVYDKLIRTETGRRIYRTQFGLE